MLRPNRSLRTLFSLGMASLMLAGCGLTGQAIEPGSLGGGVHARAIGQESLWVEPDMGATPLVQAIQGAKKSILVEMYMLTDHDVTAQVVQALVARSKAGVDVRVMLDPKPYVPTTPGQPDQGDINQQAMAALQAGGVKVQNASPAFVFTHEKGMVIDGATAYVMTCNWTNSAFSGNREYAVVDRNSADAAEVTRIFQADWAHQAYTPQDPNLVISPDNSRTKLLALIDSAKKSLVIQTEYLEDPEVLAHLGARAKAGVAINVMLAFEAPEGTDNVNADEAKLLAAQGITKVEFPQHLKMHAKMVLVDGARAFVGSENFTENSLDHNRELGILVQDPALLSTLAATARKDWAAD